MVEGCITPTRCGEAVSRLIADKRLPVRVPVPVPVPVISNHVACVRFHVTLVGSLQNRLRCGDPRVERGLTTV